MELQPQLAKGVITPNEYLCIFWLIQSHLIALFALI